MSGDLTFNKIAGAALAAGLAVFGFGELASIVYTPHHPEKAGYEIDVSALTAGEEGGAAVEAPVDWGTELANPALVSAGEAVSKKCASCHVFTQGGPNSVGPDLWAVVGRKPASHAGFAYSPAMTEYGNANPVWDYEKLNLFLTAPQKDVPGTKMTFVGLKKREDRIAMIAYLHSLGSTLPIPAPNPAGAAAPAAPEGGGAAVPPAAASGAAPAGAPVATGDVAAPNQSGGGTTGPGSASGPQAAGAAPAGGAPTSGPAAAPTQQTTNPGYMTNPGAPAQKDSRR